MQFTEAQKEEIRKRTGELAAAAETRELTPEDLEAAAGGWNWKNFGKYTANGAVMGVIGGVLTFAAVSNPIGWVTAAAAGVAVAAGTAVGIGGLAELLSDDE